MLTRRTRISLQLLPVLLKIFSCSAAEESMEELYRRATKTWRSKRSWEPWNDYTNKLLDRWESEKEYNRLEIVGGFEEGILAIEKATVARGEGENKQRDATLSQLYCAYGKTLLDLDAKECQELALDPHTLLIGIDTVSRDDDPSTYLCEENAENALLNAATLDATNSVAEELLVKLRGKDSVHRRKPLEFVAELFDSFADTFDSKLVDGLGYTVPQKVGDAAKEVRSSYQSVLDAGCGTGLAGRFLKPLVQDVMVGVDASPKMLDIAAKCTTRKGCGADKLDDEEENGGKEVLLYDDLLVLDLEEMTVENTLHKTSTESSGFDLIVAADVLVYFGSISNLLQTFADISIPGAALIFSCERASEEEAPLGWRLLASGRFSHTKQHALEAASDAGYELVLYEEIVPRMEKGEEVKGHMFGFVLKDKKSKNDEL